MSEITLDYTDCDTLSPSTSLSDANFVDMPTFSYRLRSSDAHLQPNKPQYAFVNNAAAGNSSEAQQCFVRFDVPADLEPTVLLYYKLTNFFQNHRRYVKSVNTDQLRGKAVSFDDLKNSDCKPLATNGSIIIWPCGLIANSYFNGEFPSVSSFYMCFKYLTYSRYIQSFADTDHGWW